MTDLHPDNRATELANELLKLSRQLTGALRLCAIERPPRGHPAYADAAWEALVLGELIERIGKEATELAVARIQQIEAQG